MRAATGKLRHPHGLPTILPPFRAEVQCSVNFPITLNIARICAVITLRL